MPKGEYITAQGRKIDFDLLRKRQELTPSVGNMRVNGRGDVLGPGGEIIKTNEDRINEYYQPDNAIPDEIQPRIVNQQSAPPSETPDEQPVKAKKARAKSVTSEDSNS